MSGRPAMNWADEVVYCRARACDQDFTNFNNDAACFASYCDMQARGASRDGRDDLAAELREIANEVGGQR